MTDQERLSLLALYFVSGVGNRLIKQLISYYGSASGVFKVPRGKLLKVPGLKNATVDSIRNAKTFAAAEREFKKAEREDTDIIVYTDKRYPDRLREIDDAPAVMYVKGRCNLNHSKTIGIVGTRQATSYGRATVEKIIEDLIPHNPIIVSGLAYGIDIHAHKQAIKHRLPTIGVMGSGIDVIYPSDHRETALKMMDRGGIITEYRFGAKPDAHNFPSRNRIIAGMCDALIVVEAAETGGALITAEIANSYNKDVFAIPGGINQPYSAGCNKLIKIHKASLLTSVKDLEYLLNWRPGVDVDQRSPGKADVATLSPEERQVITTIQEKGGAIQIDELTLKTCIPLGILSSLLLILEFKNWVESKPGKVYVLSKQTR